MPLDSKFKFIIGGSYAVSEYYPVIKDGIFENNVHFLWRRNATFIQTTEKTVNNHDFSTRLCEESLDLEVNSLISIKNIDAE